MEQKGNRTANPAALVPAGVFLVLYLGLGLVFEYALHMEMGFYKIPIVVVFLVALLVAFLQNRKLSFDDKLKVVAGSVGDKDIVTMILIFLAAGVFVGVTGRSSAEAVAYFLLSVTPSWAAVAVLFVAACFVSVAMGTSVGTITLITPIAVAVSSVAGFSLPLCIGSVIGGAMFGDNLSFISDTTIAACNSQGCPMRDKFRANFKIALPAALIALAVILVLSFRSGAGKIQIPEYNLWLLIPYMLVLLGGICGVNVFVVLIAGIVSGVTMMLLTGTADPVSLLENMGTGASGMFETVMVTVLVAAMCGLMREHGGFDAILSLIRRVFRGRVGGRLGIGLLVGVMDITTANNTVAIVMAGPIARDISKEYEITPKESASLLDTFSCIFQGILPYGAQMLVAVSTAISLGSTVSAFEIIPFLFYPMALAVTSLIYILLGARKTGKPPVLGKKTRWITRTAIFLALLITLQALTKGFGQIVTGSCVNALLAMSVLLGGFSSGLTVALISPVMAFLLGIAPNFITELPAMLTNAVYVLVWHLLLGKSMQPVWKQPVALAAAAVLKFGVLYGLVVQLICGVAADALLGRKLGSVLLLAPKMLQMLPAMFSWPQLVTALIGGAVALLAVPAVKKALPRKKI